MTTTKATYQIPTVNFAKFDAKIEKINRKAEKLGVEPVTVVLGTRYTVKVDKVRLREYVEVTVEGVAPRINGWTFVATLQHLGPDGNIVRTIPGAEIPNNFRTEKPVCQHCNLARRRVDTYVLQSDAGEFKQVGSNCLGDFLGALDPHNAASWCEVLGMLAPSGDGYEDMGERARYSYDLQTYLSFVAYSIETDGWMSRTKARESFTPVNPTANAAFVLMLPPKDSKEPKVVPTNSQMKLAADAVEWIRTKFPETKKDFSDYEYNMMVATRHDEIPDNLFGLAASLIPMYSRAMEWEIKRQKQAESEANSQFVGTVGKRETFDLTLTRMAVIDSGQFGPTYMHRFIDQAGNVFVWFASNPPTIQRADGKYDPLMVVGGTYQIKGTVKKHEEFRGTRQTLITRCKVETDREAK